MGFFSKKKTPEGYNERRVKELTADLAASESRRERLVEENEELHNQINELKSDIENLEAKILSLQPAKGKKVTLDKAIQLQIKAFEEQAKGMSDSQRMYAAFTAKGKTGPILIEVHTVKEARDVIAKVKSGKVKLLSI